MRLPVLAVLLGLGACIPTADCGGASCSCLSDKDCDLAGVSAEPRVPSDCGCPAVCDQGIPMRAEEAHRINDAQHQLCTPILRCPGVKCSSLAQRTARCLVFRCIGTYP